MIMISTKGRYALRVMIDLAEHIQDPYTPMKDVAKRQEVSPKYLEKILPGLVKGNLVEGVHGKGGGYKLTRKPEEYSIGEILRCAEGDIIPVACMTATEHCDRSDVCKTKPMWDKLNSLINGFLDGVNLSELM
jgi:Rrf2 family protein